MRLVAAYPEIIPLESAVRAGDWPAVKQFAGRARDAHDLEFFVRVVSEIDGSEHLLAKAMNEDDATLPNVMLAARHIILGWTARSAYRAKYVKEEQWRAFRRHLVMAEGLLIEVTAHEPGNIVAWKHRLTTARGLSLGLSEAQRRYAQLAKHDPHFFAAQGNFLQELCPKWAGNWELMFSFARECVAKAPEGTLTGALIAQAHLEKALELRGAEKTAYMRRPEVISELEAAALRSVFSPRFQKRYGWVDAHSTFALAFSIAEDHRRAAAHFAAMGNLGAKGFWGYLGGAEEQNFIKHRDRAFRKGAVQ